jgi:flavodoxin
MTNTLVVYYSLSGNTKDVAEIIAAEFDAFLEPIQDSVKRSGFLGYMRSGFEGLTGKRSVIKKPEKHPEQFDLVIVGSPVWAGNMSSPVRSYLSNHPIKSSKFAAFCTSGGPQNKKALADMSNLALQSPIATLGLSNAELESGKHKEKIETFIATIKSGLN